MWFLFSLIALVCWSGSDVFSKVGSGQDDKKSQWKVVFAVGICMGVHFIITLVLGRILSVENIPVFLRGLLYTDFTVKDFVLYLPIATVYILAMVVGYVGLRYIELSISSPICNCSGSLALLLCAIIFRGEISLNTYSIIGVILITVGIVLLGFFENMEDDEKRKLRQEESGKNYQKSVLAIFIPVAYLVIDALGTVGDQTLSYFTENGQVDISEYASNSAFEFTFFILATVVFFVFLKNKNVKELFQKKSLYLGGICETVGQIFYMAVMFDDSLGAEAGMVIISSYCALSVLLSRIFLKEKLSYKHYLSIFIAFVGIVILGIFSPV